MSFIVSPQQPLRLHGGRKSDVRTQFAALCYREVKGKLQICLVTSRGTGRWIPPKGWPVDNLTPAEAAAAEAYEEAGLVGKVLPVCIGVYSYIKPLDETLTPCMAMVYPLKVKRTLSDWPEKAERRRRWFSRKKAAARVVEPELQRIIESFDPRGLRR